MLTLVTGGPGNGKTSYVVSELLKLPKEGEPNWRPLYVWGIPDFKLPHTTMPPLAQWTSLQPIPEDPNLQEPQFAIEDGAIIVIDEAQTVYRPRSTGSKVPPHVSAIERHRHKALDIWLITQNPGLVDSNVRQLCGRHIHIKSSWSGRKLYEWSEARNPNSRTDLAEAVSTAYTLPKGTFGQYKSATEHIKPQRRIPMQVWLLLAVAVAFVVCVWWVWHRLSPEDPSDQGAVSPAVDGRPSDRPPPGTLPRPAYPAATPVAYPEHANQRSRPTVTWYVKSSTYVRVGDRVLQEDWTLVNDAGEKLMLSGDDCIGSGRRVRCDIDGSDVAIASFPPTSPAVGYSPDGMYARK
jgi:zona occludens toxin